MLFLKFVPERIASMQNKNTPVITGHPDTDNYFYSDSR